MIRLRLTAPLRLVPLLAAAALAACIANPTPHPEGGQPTHGGLDAGTGADASSPGADPSALCGALGGAWSEPDAACVFAPMDGAFNGEAPSGGTPDVDDLYSPMGPAVLGVTVTGSPGAYTFSVTVASTETGCGDYADWWEVVGADGTLAYRRVAAHSHVDEQPWTRDGGPVPLPEDGLALVRAHLSTGGFGQQVMIGTPTQGFVEARLQSYFAADLEAAEPQPGPCQY
jgi:hypothetical protein